MKHRWTSLFVTVIAVTGLGLQWAVLHALSFGTEVLFSQNTREISIGSAFAKSFSDHKNCSVCEYLSQERSGKGQPSPQQTVVIEIKAVAGPSTIFISSEFIWAEELSGPLSGNLQYIDSIPLPPPQSAA